MNSLSFRASLIPVLCVAACEAAGAEAVIDGGVQHQIIRGFGGATVFQPPELPASLTTEELDILFGNGPGQIGFTILRIRVAEDEEWRAIELAHALEAKARGASVIATPWSPPATMKTNNSLIDGSLQPESYAAYAVYLNNFARFMADHGASLYAISIQNEPDIDVDYESCDWTPEEMLEFCRDHARRITATRVIAPESFQFRRNMSDPLLNDETATANVDIIGGHIYGGGLADYPLARERGREVWMTEHLVLEHDWAASLATAKEIHDCLAQANFSAYLWWYLRRYYGPLGEDGAITKRGYVMSQFTKFVRPGYHRIEATVNPTPGIFVSAYLGEKLVIVAINQSAAAVEQAFTVTNAAVNAITPWVTSDTLNVEQQPVIAMTDGVFTTTLPAASVTTLVGDLLLEAPVIVTGPRAHTIAAGETLVLDVAASGEFLSYQWNHGQAVLPGANSRQLTIATVQPSDAGDYSVTVTNSGGSVTSAAAAIDIATTGDFGRLINLSTRSPVGVGDEVQIAGFVISGTAPRPVLVRAAGPALNVTFRLQGVLADPMLELFDQATNTVIADNDDWDASLAATFSAVNAFGWSTGSADAALVETLEPGAYTAVVRGANGGSGLSLVEVYEIGTDDSDSRPINISTRSLVGVNDDVQIGGFVIGGDTAKTVVIRAAGPALYDTFALNGVLADPVMELRDQKTRTIVATNDNWDVALTDEFSAVGAFPWTPGSPDAALLVTLDPGLYTVIVRGQDGGTGVALVEIYDAR